MDYKDTLNLPKTDFPMKANLPQREPEFLALWDEMGLYQRIQEARNGQPLYILHDGPPYANGRIHIGHALNKILKDIIVKSKTMEGYQSPYIPGWDCHGLPIEHQVTKELGEKKKTLSALELRHRCREYAEKFYKIQREEFQRLGVLGDWDHPYLTMDYQYEANIIQEFGKFVEQGGVYKGLKPVLWCTVDQTALAEAEVEYESHTSPSIYVRFPFENGVKRLAASEGFSIQELAGVEKVSVVIWTTTPWTLSANQAIALHPEIDYAFVREGSEIFIIAEKLVEGMAKACELKEATILGVRKGKEGFEGLLCQRPLSDGLSHILLGDFVTLEQGTGCVHIAPGHGMDDYLLALKYNAEPKRSVLAKPLDVFVPVDDAGRFKEGIQDLAGQHVLKANPGIIEKLKGLGLLVGHGTVDHTYPHCWRCKNPVIFRATQQWFVSMEKGELRSRALNEIDKVEWIPARGRDRIHGMILNRPDWCLSRQRTWGTPIPGFTCAECQATLADPKVIAHIAELVGQHGADVWFEKSADKLLPSGTVCPHCRCASWKKEQDILDVWFESGVSHAAVVKAHGQEWWPASLYLEGSDQHRGWFHSALLSSVTTDQRAPYRAVLTHGFVVDGQGKKMSKSAGNVVTPQEVIKQSGAEILRLWVSAQDYQEDLRISKDILSQLVEAYRKIRNTCRFLLSNLYDFDPSTHRVPYHELQELDRWALMRVGKLIVDIRKDYEVFLFHNIFQDLTNFCSVDMSSVYLDILKDRLYTFPKDSRLRRGSQTVLLEVLVVLTKLMAPILSFTAEEIWRHVPKGIRQSSENNSVHLSLFPERHPDWIDPDLEHRWDQLLRIRNVVQGKLEEERRLKTIGSSLDAKVFLYTQRSDPASYDSVKPYEDFLATLFIVSDVELVCVDQLPTDPQHGVDLGMGIAVKVEKSKDQKCERCWNYRRSVGTNTHHPTLCDRCFEAVG